MKNKLFALLFIAAFLVAVTGCGKEKTLKKIEVNGPRVVCTYTNNEDDIKTDTIITLKFNSDNYVNYQLYESTMTFKNKDTFNAYANAMESDDTELGENVEYDYSINKSKKQITTYMIYKEALFDYSNISDEEKEDYKASVIVKKYSDNAECKFIEITKKDLGIE